MTLNDVTSTTSIASSCTVTTTATSGSCTVNEPTISRANYNPLGYATSSTATTGSTPYAGGGTRTLTSNITLYAITELSDTTKPTCTAVTPVCLKKGSDTALTKFVTCTDAESGIANITAKIGSTTVTNLSSYGTGSYTVTYTATDKAGNVSTAVTSTINIYSKIVDDQTAYTVGTHTVDGLYNDPYTSGRYIFRGADPNNYVTFNGETWRILAIETDGTYKIVHSSVLSDTKRYHSASSNVTNYDSMEIEAYLNETYYATLTTTAQSQLEAHDFPAGVLSYENGTSASSNTIAQTIPLEQATLVNKYVALPSTTDYLRASSNCTDSDVWSTFDTSPYKCMTNNWMHLSSVSSWWVLNPYSSTYARYIKSDGDIASYNPTNYRSVRPTIYLSDQTTFTGSGTSSDPYVINSSCKIGQNATSYVTCTLEAEDGWLETQTLTIKPSTTTGVTYSFDGTTYNSTTQKNVSAAGTYNAYVKDSDGGTNSCSVSLASRTEYQSTTCPSSNLSFGEWYLRFQNKVIAASEGCISYSKSGAEADNANWYRECTYYSGTSSASVCSYAGISGACYRVTEYSRNAECSDFTGGTVSGWGTTVLTANFKTQVDTRITYAAE